MEKNILLILTILIFTTKSISQGCEYTKYYPLVKLAHKNYSDKKYKEAEKNFKLAFINTKHPFGADLHIAFTLAQKRKNTEWAEQIAIQLVKGGVPLRYFRYHKKSDWYQKFNADFKTYSDYYKKNYNQELKDSFVSLINRDREFNRKYHDWRTRKIELTLEELINEASKIISEFNQITDKYGFPNEKLMGYHYDLRKNSIEHYHSATLLIHIYQRGLLVLKNEIGKIACDGGLHPKYEKILEKIRGFGNSTGVEQEMKVRYAKYRGTE